MKDIPIPTFAGDLHFSKDIADFVVKEELTLLVETGAGMSTFWMLWALQTLDKGGHLYSIDPNPWFPEPIPNSPLNTLIKKRSGEALEQLAKDTPPWDMFIHDGCHNVWSQTFEYYFAWGRLRKGGWLVSDDYSMNNQTAWKDFTDSIGMTDKWVTLHPTQKIQKQTGEIRLDISAFAKECADRAFAYEKKWIATGHKVMPFFQDYEGQVKMEWP